MTAIDIGDVADILTGAQARVTWARYSLVSMARSPHTGRRPTRSNPSAPDQGTIDAMRRDAWRPAEAGGITR
ncbi:MAG: hypothetical protein ACRENQ_01265 [Gemmatimonadaceae bacterium]